MEDMGSQSGRPDDLEEPCKRRKVDFFLDNNSNTPLFENRITSRSYRRRDLSLAKEFSVQLPNERMECNITGLTIMGGGTLLLIDSNNSCLKLLDAAFELQSHMVMQSLPWDVTRVSSNEAAVTLPNENSVLFFAVQPSMIPTRQIYVPDGCYGIAYGTERLYVGYKNRVSVLDKSGNPLSSISLQGEEPCRDVYALAVSHDGMCIFACDRYNRSVTGFTPDGEAVFAFKVDSTFEPCGIDTDSEGLLYVCDATTKCVRVMTASGEVCQKLFMGDYPEIQPRSVVFSSRRKQLIVAGSCCNTAKVFNLSVL